jgi:uncharacterized protein YozE (UPF0346 family)
MINFFNQNQFSKSLSPKERKIAQMHYEKTTNLRSKIIPVKCLKNSEAAAYARGNLDSRIIEINITPRNVENERLYFHEIMHLLGDIYKHGYNTLKNHPDYTISCTMAAYKIKSNFIRTARLYEDDPVTLRIIDLFSAACFQDEPLLEADRELLLNYFVYFGFTQSNYHYSNLNPDRLEDFSISAIDVFRKQKNIVIKKLWVTQLLMDIYHDSAFFKGVKDEQFNQIVSYASKNSDFIEDITQYIDRKIISRYLIIKQEKGKSRKTGSFFYHLTRSTLNQNKMNKALTNFFSKFFSLEIVKDQIEFEFFYPELAQINKLNIEIELIPKPDYQSKTKSIFLLSRNDTLANNTKIRKTITPNVFYAEVRLFNNNLNSDFFHKFKVEL